METRPPNATTTFSDHASLSGETQQPQLLPEPSSSEWVAQQPLSKQPAALLRSSSVRTPRWNAFTHSKYFVKSVSKVFKEVDVDQSGTIDAAELFVAVLLMNHSINKLPLFRRREPPTAAQVKEMLQQETSNRCLTEDEFLRFCQLHFVDVGRQVVTSMFVLFVVCPFVGTRIKRAALSVGPLHDLAAAAPESVYLAVAGTAIAQVQTALHSAFSVSADRRRRLLRVAMHLLVMYAALLAARSSPMLAQGLATARERAGASAAALDRALQLRAVRGRQP